VEARGGARLSPGTFPDPPHALLPTHIGLQKRSLDFVWLITYGHGHHCIFVENLAASTGNGDSEALAKKCGFDSHNVMEGKPDAEHKTKYMQCNIQ